MPTGHHHISAIPAHSSIPLNASEFKHIFFKGGFKKGEKVELIDFKSLVCCLENFKFLQSFTFI